MMLKTHKKLRNNFLMTSYQIITFPVFYPLIIKSEDNMLVFIHEIVMQMFRGPNTYVLK